MSEFIISTKDIIYIEEVLNQFLLHNKKLDSYLELIVDEDLKKHVTKLKSTLNNEYTELLEVIK